MSERSDRTRRARRAIQAALASAVGRALTMTFGLVSVPILLKNLGIEKFGIWSAIVWLPTLAPILDFGLSSGLVNLLARAESRGEEAVRRKCVATAFWVLSALGVLLFGLSILVMAGTPGPVQLFGEEMAARPSQYASLMLALVGLLLPFSVVYRIQFALQDGAYGNAGYTIALLAGNVSALASSFYTHSIGRLVIAFLLPQVLIGVVWSYLYYRVVRPDLWPGLAVIDGSLARELLKRGFVFFLIQISGIAVFYADSAILLWLKGAVVAGTYAIVQRAASSISTLAEMLLQPLWPAYADAKYKGDHAWSRALFSRSVQASVFGALLCSAVLVYWRTPIFSLWLRRTYEVDMFLLFGVLTAATMQAAGSALAMYLNANDLLWFEAKCAIAMLAVGIPAKVLLVGRLDASGVAWGTVVSYALAVLIPCCLLLVGHPLMRANQGASLDRT